MATQVQNRRGTTAEHTTFTGANGELTVDTDKDVVVVHDGSTVGGHPMLKQDGSNSAIALGSAGTPSIKFTGDTNTGIYSPGADQLAISTNGTGRLFVAAGGNVGIGTSSPDRLVHIYKGSAGSAVSDSNTVLMIENNNHAIIQLASPNTVSNRILFGDPEDADTGRLIYDHSTDSFQTFVNGSERMRITSAGLVGIGTSSPSSLLDLNGGYASISNNSDDYRLRWRRTDGSFTGGLSVDGFYKLSFKLADAGGTTQDRLVIDSLGRVGIGTTAPIARLDVATVGDSSIVLANETTYTDGIKRGRITKKSDNSLEIRACDSASAVNTVFLRAISTESCRLDTSGRLLVGTSSAYSFTNTYGTSISASVQAAGSDLHASQLLAHFANGLNANRTGSLAFARSQGAPGVFTAVSNGVKLGEVSFHGADGTSFVLGAAINAVVDGAVSTGDMPCRLVFSTTADGAASPTERMRIDSSGKVGIGTTSPLTQTHITATSAGTGAIALRLENNSGTAGTETILQFAANTSNSTIRGAQISGLLESTNGTNLLFYTNPNTASPLERARIDSSGRLLVGTSTSVTTKAIQVEGTDGNTGSISIRRNTNAQVAAAGLELHRSRGSASASFTSLSNNDKIGNITFSGADGTSAIQAGAIECAVDGTPGTNDMPGRLVFSTTADGAASPTERMRITSGGLVGIGISGPEKKLHIVDTSAGTTTTPLLIQNRGNAASTATQIALIATGSDFSDGQYAAIKAYSSQGTGYTSHDLAFLTCTSGGTPTERLFISRTGAVGIGSTGPGSTLDVRGNVRLGNQANGDGTTVISASNGVFIGTNDGSTSSTVVPLQIGAYPASPGYSSTPDQAIVLDGWSGSTIYHNAIVNRKGRELSFHTAITGNSFTDTNERARIDSSGRLLLGTSSSRSNIGGNTAFGSHVQIESAGTDLGTLSLINNFAVGYPAAFTIGATGGSTVGSNSIVNAQEDIGIINFVAADGTNLIRAASITAFVDGTPGANDMPGRLVLSTTASGASSPTERMRITSDGNALFNSTTLGFANNKQVQIQTSSTGLIAIQHPNTESSGAAYIWFVYNGGAIGSITQNGTTGISYNTNSDYRLKENVVDITDGITRVKQLLPKRFNFIVDADTTVDGFLAHEAQTVVPEAVTGEKDGEEMQGIDQSKLVPLLTAALQEAIAKIETLEQRLTDAGIA